jgi:START domain
MFKFIFFSILFSLNAQASINKNWQFLEDKNGISVYQTKIEGTKLVGSRGEAIINAPLNRILFVLSDIDRSFEWVDGLKTSKVLEQNGLLETVVYQEFNLPWPISNRDFVFRGTARKEADGRVVIEIKSEDHPLAPKTTGVRGELIESRYTLTPMGDSQTKLEVEVLCDPKGMIPTWLVNLIQKSWPQKTLTALMRQLEKPYVVNTVLPKTIKGL